MVITKKTQLVLLVERMLVDRKNCGQPLYSEKLVGDRKLRAYNPFPDIHQSETKGNRFRTLADRKKKEKKNCGQAYFFSPKIERWGKK